MARSIHSSCPPSCWDDWHADACDRDLGDGELLIHPQGRLQCHDLWLMAPLMLQIDSSMAPLRWDLLWLCYDLLTYIYWPFWAFFDNVTHDSWSTGLDVPTTTFEMAGTFWTSSTKIWVTSQRLWRGAGPPPRATDDNKTISHRGWT